MLLKANNFSIGIGFAFGGARNGFTLELGANKGRGNANRPGIALTEAQINALGQNIVWLVEQNVTLPGGGTERVLVPQVYLSEVSPKIEPRAF